VGKTNECIEQIERLEHKKETLLRENEKLRSQSRNKTPLAGHYSTRQASSGAVGSSIMKASFNGQLLKTPTSFASRLKENGGSTTPTRAHGLFLGIQKANFSKDTEHLRLNTDALTSRENFSLTQRVGSSIRGGGFYLNGFGKHNFEQTSNAESKQDQENEMEFGSNK